MNLPIPPKRIVILVVEDEVLLRLTVADMLEERGFSVREAGNGLDALEQLELHTEVCLVLTDIQMPGGLDGIELIKIIHERWPHMLLMITSGRVQPRDEDLPDDARFVPKPFTEREIFKQMDDLLSKHPDRQP